MSKNIAIFCDGTNNEIAGNQTNVLRLFRMLVQDEKQIAYYDSGVGTHIDTTSHSSIRQRLYKKIDGAVGMSIRDGVLDAYHFLMEYYEEGDQIYLVGFSRGAYTVRSLAAMIKLCGLLRPAHQNLSDYAWSICTNADGTSNISSTLAATGRIRKVFGQPTPIHFIGVWDTVSVFGWVWDPRTIPFTDKNDQVAHVRHALAIDERRSYFTPTHFTPVSGQDELSVWFPGVHADIGGGYPRQRAGLSRITLKWMMGEATQLGLRLDPDQSADQLSRIKDSSESDALGTMHDESKQKLWRASGILPRKTFSPLRQKMTWQWPNHATHRVIPEQSNIHSSVIERINDAKDGYCPQLPADYDVVSPNEPT